MTEHAASRPPEAPKGTFPNGRGLTIARHFTSAGRDVYADIAWNTRTSRISNPDGSVVFEMKDAEVPAAWSQVAADIMVSKYFRKAGVPQTNPDGTPQVDEASKPVLGPERSAKQVIGRLTGAWRWWGEQHGYFATPADAEAFEAELQHMLVTQMAAPNSPQWFNTGLAWAYGITGPAQGHYYVDPADGKVKQSTDAYTRPQPHACFIQSVSDDLVNPGGIMDLWVREARIFKYGSGTGTNFSAIRGEGEPLSGGGTSSGLMSFLKVGDRAAGAIKSGGTTRRAAKMVTLDVDHPDIQTFIAWKANEEKKVAALIAAGYPGDFNGEAYATVSGQNSNNSVRVSNAFLRAVRNDEEWQLTRRTDGAVARTVQARDLWRQMAEASWACADPGLQYDGTINEWHTAPESGRINGSNPCSEYMFLDNSACNLASLNLLRFVDEQTGAVDIAGMRHAVRLWTIVLEISVLMAQFPSEEIARISYEFRTLGLGYANLGTILMRAGLPYDSDQSRAFAGAITAIMTGESYATSAELAKHLGPFPGYRQNERHMLRVIRNHRRAAWNAPADDYEQLSVLPMPIDPDLAPADLLAAARDSWDRALATGELYGYRNAQVSLLAPTGTIGLLMDCDTTGVEPDFALVKFKKLAGGGYFKIANQSVEPALENLGYDEAQRKDILRYLLGSLSLADSPHINRESLKAKGFTDATLKSVEQALPATFELSFAFSPWSLGEETLKGLGFTMEQATAPNFDLLRALGFSNAQINEANEVVCGTMTVEGAPHLKPEHLPVFDCANKNGKKGQRYISAHGHIAMMGAAQSFLSGAISKTINMPNEATIEDIENVHLDSWKHGIKAIALYRDGSKMSQPLSTKSDRKDEDEALDPDEIKQLIADAVAEAVAQAESDLAAHHETLHTQLAASQAETATAKAEITRLKTDLDRATATGGSPAPYRRRLPARRSGFTQEARVAGHKVFLRTGEYEDGTLGEIFIDMHKEGAAYRSMINSFAIAISKGLQYGVPLEEFVETFTFVRFEPQGMVTGHPNIKMATSMIDYVFRVVGLEYLHRTDLVQVQPDLNTPADASPSISEAASPVAFGGTSGGASGGSPAGSAPTGGASAFPNWTGAIEPGSKSATTSVETPPATSHASDAGPAPTATSEPVTASAATATPPISSVSDAGHVDHHHANGNGTTNGNGGGHSHDHESVAALPELKVSGTAVAERPTASRPASDTSAFAVIPPGAMGQSANQMDAYLGEMMGDAPFCDVCGHITVRNGACYKCLNCGNSLGCS